MKYTHILFDLDGTVVNSECGVTNGVRYALDKYGIKEQDRAKLRRFLGPPLVDSFMEFYGFSSQDAHRLTDLYREYYRSRGVHENTLYEGVRELLHTLHQEGFQVWLATSKPTEFAHVILQDLELLPYFNLVAGASLDGSRNTKESVLAYAMQSGGVTDPAGLLMVGDRYHDIKGAHAFGIDAAAVLYGFGSRAEFLQYRAEYIVEKADELLPICRRGRP